MKNPIYKPSGAAAEYGDWALNIYTGCNHGCTYCYAPAVLRKSREEFAKVEPRPGIVEATEKQLKAGYFVGQTIHLCFTCDPYPAGIDTTATREIVKLIHKAGANVQILTKGGDRARRDFDLLGPNDWFGITLTCFGDSRKEVEPMAVAPVERVDSLADASLICNTWISFEPVISVNDVLFMIKYLPHRAIGRKVFLKIGKLNYQKNDTDWADFGHKAEAICKENGWNYMIKKDLRAAMGVD